MLIDLKLIHKANLAEILGECAAYLNHPNLWVRHETCGLLAASTRLYSAIDVQCKLMPIIGPHLRGTVLLLERADIVMSNLHAPISWPVFDSVTRFADIRSLMTTLEKRVTRRKLEAEAAAAGQLQQHSMQAETMSVSLKNFFRRLTDESLTELEKMQLLSMQTYLLKLNKHRAHEQRGHAEGKITVQKLVDVCHEFPLSDWPTTANGARGDAGGSAGYSGVSGGALDWQHMFGMLTGTAEPAGKGNNDHYQHYSAGGGYDSMVVCGLAERNHLQERHAECRTELDAMCGRLKQQYRIIEGTRNFDSVIDQRDLPYGWRMKGNLVAHLHEHRAAVTKLTALNEAVGGYMDLGGGMGGGPMAGMFASCSLDGTVRVWDIGKLDGNQSINRSSQVYTANVPLYSMASADGGHSLAVAGRDGSLMLLALQEAKNLNEPSTAAVSGGELPLGPIVDMQPLAHGSQSLILYATLYGTIVCWDLRMPEAAWQVKTALRNGVVTTICADPTSSWMATGTSGGKHVCWDLRFRLPIAEIRHPFDYRIRKIVAHPTEHSKLISTTAGNNEVSIWDIETGHRQGALWASNAPPLTNQGNQNATSSTVTGLVTGTINRSPFVLTAGSDQRIRYWDLAAIERPNSGGGGAHGGAFGGGGGNYLGHQFGAAETRGRYMQTPKNCAVVVPAARETTPDTQYDSRLIDGTAVIYEISTASGLSSGAASGGGSTVGSGTTTMPTANASAGVRSSAASAASAGGSSSGGGGGSGSGPSSGNSTEEQQPRSGPDQPAAGHNDVITDLLMCRSLKHQLFVASASRDGVIKLWK